MKKNKSGKTPAHFAAWRGKAECVGFLAVNAVDVIGCRDNDGKLPIDLAAEDGHKDTIIALQWIENKLRSLASPKSSAPCALAGSSEEQK